MLTKRNDKTKKRGLAAMGALSVLLGAQMGVLASTSSSGSPSASYSYGYADAWSLFSLYGEAAAGRIVIQDCIATYGAGDGDCLRGGAKALGDRISGGGGLSNR